MQVDFCFEVISNIPSKLLWGLIEQYHVNLIDTIDHTYVYGQTDMDTFLKVLKICREHGSITGGEVT